MFGFDLMSMVAGVPGLIIALALHEYAHARVAVAMGDFTPRMMGRLTLNPMAHIDPVGLLMLLIARFGWAKPVIINPMNFRDPQKGEIWVAAAGPAMNFLIAFLAMTFMMIYTIVFNSRMSVGLHEVMWLIVLYNINFGIFNLIPLPPLDGSKILMQLFPYDLQYKLQGLERYSFLIFIVMIATPVMSLILIPLERLIINVYASVLQLFFGILL